MKNKQWILASLILMVAVATYYLLTQNQLENSTSGVALSTKSEVSLELAKAEYVGSKSCESCHQEETNLWQQSDHFKSMSHANSESVLGDFSNVTVSFHKIDSRFYQQDGGYFIETIGDLGKVERFQVKYTFGYHPLQQYLLETDGGRLQAFNIAWDSRSVEEGGQRWFHLQPSENISPEHPFFWTKHFQNWNSRCADCHSTNLERGYSENKNTFVTTFSEVNVACEACHGAASNHLNLALSGKLDQRSGFAVKASEPLRWQFSDTKSIAKASGVKNSDDVNMCGRCHSLRSQLTSHADPTDFHNDHRLQLPNEVSYFADGQIKEEAFVLGSFLQSKMHHKGVSCRNCHEPHSGKVFAQDNSLCAQCHKPDVYDSTKHHNHSVEKTVDDAKSEGAQCVNCHMPDRAFMVVDDRRDHSFTIPRPDLSLQLGVPNACTGCHADRDDQWALNSLITWNSNRVGATDKHSDWARLMRSASNGDVLVTRSAVESILDTGLPNSLRAALLQQLAPMPSRVSADVARKSLYDKSPLVRRAAVLSLQGHSAEVQWQTLAPFMKDVNLSVRIQIADGLLGYYSQLNQDQQKQLKPLIDELRESYTASADSVTTQLNIANFEVQMGNFNEAENAYNQAQLIAPAFVPGLLAKAEFLRRSNREQAALPLLSKALKVAPDSGGVHHSLGLYYVRQKNYQSAILHLQQAVDKDDASPYYAYVYAVALENQNQLSNAIEVLEKANKRWPNQYELLTTVILFYEKAGRTNDVLPVLSKLSRIAPASPVVKQLISKYR